MKQWGHRIDDRLFVADPTLFANGKVRNGLTTKRDQSRDLIGIDSMFLEPFLVESNHAGEIPSCRMSTHKDLLSISTESFDVLKCPRNRSCRIFDIRGCLSSRTEPVVRCNDAIPFSFKAAGISLFPLVSPPP